MKRIAILCLLAATSACATMDRSRPSWLAGSWLMMEDGANFPLSCASGLPIRYLPDGAYRLMEERGVWRLQGDRLTETILQTNEAGPPEEEVEIGRPYESRIERMGPDSFRKSFADGDSVLFRRCPEPR